MKIDLHVHTHPRSSCSDIDPAEMMEEASRIGLDALCITEHDCLWPSGELAQLAEGHNVRLFRGNEVTTNQGHIVVLGLDESITGVVTIEELRGKVEDAAGFMIVAHPFRGFRMFGVGQLALDLDQACQRPVFNYVDAVEILNSKVTATDNDMARRVAERLGMPGVAGSDAHHIDEIGRYITVIEHDVLNERELAEALRAGRFTTAAPS